MLVPIEQLIDILLLAPLNGFPTVLNAKPVDDGAEFIHRVSHGVSRRVDDGAGLSNGMADGEVLFAVQLFCKGVAVQDLSLGRPHLDVSCSP